MADTYKTGTKEGDKVRRQKEDLKSLKKATVVKVKPDGTRITKDKYGKLRETKDPHKA